MADATPRPRLLAFFGHHKCMTTTVTRILAAACAPAGLRYRQAGNSQQFGGDLPGFIERNGCEAFAYINADYRFLEGLSGYRGFHVIRDPRDVLVSAYFSHLYSHQTRNWPELVEHRRRLQSASREEGLMLELEFRQPEFAAMDAWNYDDPSILELRMEDLTADMIGSFRRIFRFLDFVQEAPSAGARARFAAASALNRLHKKSRGAMPLRVPASRIPAGVLDRIVAANDFSRLSGGRAPGQEDVRSHFRKGKAGDWRNHFSEKHVEVFKQRHNDLLVKLGYEADANWGLEPAATSKQ